MTETPSKTYADYEEEKELAPQKKIIEELFTLSQTINENTNWVNFANAFVKHYGIYYDKNGLWWIWQKTKMKWEEVDDTEIMNAIDAGTGYTPITVRSQIKNEILEALKRQGRLHAPEEPEKNWLQFKGNTINIETGETFKTTKKHFFTNPIPWDIGKISETPNMDKIFEEWVGKENIKLLYEIIAYCTYTDYPIHRIFCFTGSGSNGKSKFFDLLTKFLGNENTCATQLDILMQNHFESWQLYKKLVCFMGETNFGTLKRTQTLKTLTGQDPVRFEKKNKTQFTGKNYAKILINTNSLPVTYDKTKGFYRRWLIIDFPNEFPETTDVLSRIPDEEYSFLAKKITILLKELLKVRAFTNEGTIEQRAEKYEAKSNPLAAFLKQYCENNAQKSIPCFEFYDYFVSYLKMNGYRLWNKKELGMAMREHGIEVRARSIQKDSGDWGTWKYYEGIGFLDLKKANITDNTDNTDIVVQTIHMGIDLNVGNNSNIGNKSINNPEKQPETVKFCAVCGSKACFLDDDKRFLCSQCYEKTKEINHKY